MSTVLISLKSESHDALHPQEHLPFCRAIEFAACGMSRDCLQAGRKHLDIYIFILHVHYYLTALVTSLPPFYT